MIQALWLRYLPRFLRERLEHRPKLQAAIENTGWLFAERVFRLGVGLVVSVWVARYLGPQKFGLLNYVIAIVALFDAIATLGLRGVVVRDLVKEPKSANITLGTAFVLQAGGGLLALVFAIVAVGFARPDDGLAKLMVVVLGGIMVLKSTEVVKYWFESQVQSKYSVWVENSAFALFAIVKVVLILNRASLMAFVWALFAEAALAALGLLAVYGRRVGRLGVWRARYARARELLRQSWPLILSGLAVMVYMRIDQVMLGQMLGDEAVGIYAAAVRLSEVWYFIPAAIVASVFPSIVEAKGRDVSLYYQRLQKLCDVMVMQAWAVAIPVTFLAGWIISILYGPVYAGAGAILSLHVWTGVFVALGVASGQWFLIENMQMQAFYRTGLGVLANVAANLVLIPRYGAIGAAIGTLVSQIFAAYLFDFLGGRTRRSFLLKTAALLPFMLSVRRRARRVGATAQGL